jgi:2-methylisocitrate lyase-like PEP mutase family enzyme
MDPTERRARFRQLHQDPSSGCFVMPNPWDRGSAVLLGQLGFPALATSSAAFAFARALPDSPTALDRDVVLANVAEIVTATDLPVNADFQAGYGDDPEAVADSVRRCVDVGVAGLSIEDATGDPDRPLFDLPDAIERVRAARRAIDGSGVLLTARAECFLVGHPDPLRESLRRLAAYAEAGADVLYAPGLPLGEVGAVVREVHPLPLNVLVSSPIGARVADLAALGVRRISVGSGLARVGWTAMLRAAAGLAGDGDFAGFAGALGVGDLSARFGS